MAAPSTDEVLARVRVLHRKLEDEGMYVRANTVFLAIEEIVRLRSLIQAHIEAGGRR